MKRSYREIEREPFSFWRRRMTKIGYLPRAFNGKRIGNHDTIGWLTKINFAYLDHHMIVRLE